MRPFCSNFLLSDYPFFRSALQVFCQVSVGIVPPVGGLMTEAPPPAIVSFGVIGLASDAFILDFPVGEVVRFALPAIGPLLDTVRDHWRKP